MPPRVNIKNLSTFVIIIKSGLFGTICIKGFKITHYLIREIKTWLNINYVTVHNSIFYN